MPTEAAYVGTSDLGAYYCPESLSLAAETALRKIPDPAISALAEVEFASLIARKRRLGDPTSPRLQWRRGLEFSGHCKGLFGHLFCV